MKVKEKARKDEKASFMYKGKKYVRATASNASHLVVYKLAGKKVSRKRKSAKKSGKKKAKRKSGKKKSKRKSGKKKAKRKSVKKKSKRKCKHGRDPVSGKCRKKSGGNKGDLSRSKKDYE